MNLSNYLRSATIPMALLACAVSTHAQSRYTYSATGDEVTDSQTGLVWRRCSEGQSWGGGTCTGTARTYTYEAALVQAQAQSGTAGWRLPNVKELSSITDKTRVNSAIDPTAFPRTPSEWFWTSTPYAGLTSDAWVVGFGASVLGDGAVSYNWRFIANRVRLVR